MGEIEESRLMEITADCGLEICATHEPGARICDETDAVIERLKKLNCRHTAYPFPHLPRETKADVLLLAEKLNASDVFVLPSFYEGLPLVLIEALACGLQAICTDLPGIRPWMNRTVPNHGVCFVKPPEMENEDEALPESLLEFEQRLAAAIDTIGFMPTADLDQVCQVSWDCLCGKIVNLWNNL
jgi:glycosyltransferase involved in cell wall biosynthesis